MVDNVQPDKVNITPTGQPIPGAPAPGPNATGNASTSPVSSNPLINAFTSFPKVPNSVRESNPLLAKAVEGMLFKKLTGTQGDAPPPTQLGSG